MRGVFTVKTPGPFRRFAHGHEYPSGQQWAHAHRRHVAGRQCFRVRAGKASSPPSSGGALDGVTVNGTLDVGRQNNSASLSVLNGLTLNGTLYVGNATNSWCGQVGLSARKPWAACGHRNFRQSRCVQCAARGYRRHDVDARFGPHGARHSGQIGQSTSCIGTPANVTVINQGNDFSGCEWGTIFTRGQSFLNAGVLGATNGGHPQCAESDGQRGPVALVSGSAQPQW